MTRGWFDAFRENGGPTLYSYSNRTAVTADVATLTLYIVFLTLFVAFVIIFPGVRRQRFTTFTSVTLSLFVGTAILGIFQDELFDSECYNNSSFQLGSMDQLGILQKLRYRPPIEHFQKRK